jgi:PhoH-like ATPase
MTRSKRIYVLDTNVLMHDPTALFKFEEHDIYLPMTVLEELDNAKKGLSEVSRNARQVSRFINELIEANGADKIGDGLKLVRPQGLQLKQASQIGKLRFQTAPVDAKGKLGKAMPDNQILASIMVLREDSAGVPVVLVSKDINLRIKAHDRRGAGRGLRERPRARRLQPALHRLHELPDRFWQKHEKDLRSWNEKRPHLLRSEDGIGRGLAPEPVPVSAGRG